jgi:hypothetical protein
MTSRDQAICRMMRPRPCPCSLSSCALLASLSGKVAPTIALISPPLIRRATEQAGTVSLLHNINGHRPDSYSRA